MIVTFYSFKGGVGRSMAMANIGTWLYQQGRRVLLVDWDLEAPGVESFFYHSEAELKAVVEKPGLVDLFESYRHQWDHAYDLKDEKEGGQSKAGQLIERIGPIQHLFLPLAGTQAEVIKRRDPGIWLLHAGCRAGDSEAIYTKTINSLDWARFYDEYGGYEFIEWLKREFKKDVDFILIDSRTGLTEMGGVCTQHLADIAVCFIAPNDSNLHGIERITEVLLGDELKNLRGSGRPLSVLPIPTRVDTQGESDQLVMFEKKFRNAFGRFKEIDVDWCWESRIRYVTRYSYNEQVLFLDSSGHPDLMEAYGRIGQRLHRLYDERLTFYDQQKWKGSMDSVLERKTKKSNDKESARRTVQQLIDTALEKLEAGDVNTAESLLTSAMALAETDLGRDHKDTLSVKKNLASVLFAKADFKAALPLQAEVFDNSRRILGEDHPDTVQSQYNLGYLLQALGRYDAAIELYSKSLDIYAKIGNSQGMADTYFNLGMIRQEQGDHQTAAEFYTKSLEIYERIGNYQGTGNIYYALGMIRQEQGDHETAAEFYAKSLELHERISNYHGMAKIYYSLGMNRQSQNDPEGALKFYQSSLRIHEKSNDLKGVAKTCIRMGQLMADINRESNAFALILRAFQIYSELSDPEAQAALKILCWLALRTPGDWQKWLADIVNDEKERFNLSSMIAKQLEKGEEGEITLSIQEHWATEPLSPQSKKAESI